MSIISADTGSPPADRAVDQGAQLAGHVAAVVQAGELVGDRQLQRMVEVVAQEVGVALASIWLRTRAASSCGSIGRVRMSLMPDVQRLDQPRAVVRIDHAQDRQVPGRLVGAHLGGEAQAVEAAGAWC